MSKPDLMPLAEEERADLLALLHDLTPARGEPDRYAPNGSSET